MLRCLNCSRVNPADSKFCADCGGRLPISPLTREVTPEITAPNWAYIVMFVGAFFLLSGWSAIEAANTSEQMYSGTILENDPFSNQLNENMRNKGYSECAVGIVLCLIGTSLARIGEKHSGKLSNDGDSRRKLAKELARKRNPKYRNWWEEEHEARAQGSAQKDTDKGKFSMSCPNCQKTLKIPYWFHGNARCPVCDFIIPIEGAID
tara:strand:+ start:1088 stop:1708 length:621 start_codon:yes stop_codon:yes gene_type:complete